MEHFRVKSCVGSQSCKPDPTNPSGSLTKNYPRWGWLGWACETTGQPITPTKTFWEAGTGEELLWQCENSNHADPFAVVAVKSLRTSGSTTLNERYWSRFLVGRAYAFYTSTSHVGQLEKGDPVDQWHSQWGVSCKRVITNVDGPNLSM